MTRPIPSRLASILALALLYAPAAWAEAPRRVLRSADLVQEDLQAEYAALARASREASIRMLKEMLAHGEREGEQRAEMLLRLAELCHDQGRQLYLEGMAGALAVEEACPDGAACAPPPDPAQGPALRWREESVRLYRLVLRSYPWYARADEATRYLAGALAELGREEEALHEWRRLARSYPDSPWVPEAYLMIGEHHFQRDELAPALAAYRRAAAWREAEMYPFALYKLAWCLYNLQEYGSAIDTMKSVVAQARVAERQRGGIDLGEEALRDLARFFADAGDLEEAWAFYQQQGRPDLLRSCIELLARSYHEQGKFRSAIRTWRRLIGHEPQHAEAPRYQHEILRAARLDGDLQRRWREAEILARIYGPGGSWERAHAERPELLAATAERVEGALRQEARQLHSQARKRGSDELRALALGAYRTWLASFAGHERGYDMRYGLAELLWELEDLEAAHAQYVQAVTLRPQGEHSAFCAESAIFAAERLARQEPSATPPDPRRPAELGHWEQELLAALDRYAALYPQADKTPNIIYRAAWLLYHKNHFAEASQRFRQVIAMDPSSREAEQAAELIMDSLALVEDWSTLCAVARAFWQQQGLGSEAFRLDAREVHARARFRLVEAALEAGGDRRAAAAALLALQREHPQAAMADLALHNAAFHLRQLGATELAMEASLRLVEGYPDSAYLPDQLAALGFDHESLAQFAEAAQWYQRLFRQAPGHASAPAALYSAARFHLALGEWSRAADALQRYLAAYPARAEAAEIELELAGIFQDNGRWQEAVRIYQSYLSGAGVAAAADRRAYASLQLGLSLQALDRDVAARQAWQQAADCWREDSPDGGSAREAAAQALFLLVEEDFARFTALGIPGPAQGARLGKRATDRLLQRQTRDKALALQQLERRYAQVVDSGSGAWGLAALAKLGQAYENMSSSLLQSYVPPQLSAAQRQLYLDGLEEEAWYQREKAAEAYAAALSKAFELSLYTRPMALAARRLAELRPEAQVGLEEKMLAPVYFSGPALQRDYARER